MKKFLIYLCAFFILPSLQATHIVGGELSYALMDSSTNSYRISLKVYRDCLNGQAPFDATVNIFIYEKGDTSFQVLPLSFRNENSFPSNRGTANGCLSSGPSICIDENTYSGIFDFAPSDSGYSIGWARCCWASSLNNLVSPQHEGITFTAFISPTNTKPNTSPGPNIQTDNTRILCESKAFQLDLSLYDMDGDSLSYELVAPYSGLNILNQGVGNPTVGGNNPVVDNRNVLGPPPYIESPWNVGYSSQNPLNASMLIFDSESGLLIGEGVSTGTYVLSIETSEYRDGELLAKSRRTFILYFLVCAGENLEMELSFVNSTINPSTSPIFLEGGEDLCFDVSISSPDTSDFIGLRMGNNSLPIDINPTVGSQPLDARICYTGIDDLEVGECGLIILESSSATYCPGLRNSSIVLQVCKSANAIRASRLGNELSEQIQLYPNPGQNELSLNFISKGTPDYSIKIWDSQGRLLYQRMSGEPIKIHTAKWPSGLYHVQVEHEGKYGIKSWLKS